MPADSDIKFPTAWLTYKKRIKLDLARAWGEDVNDSFFNESYSARVVAQAKQLEDWLVKLLVLQLAITGFQVIGFVGNDASISLFGITLKQAAGVKEILLAFSATLALATWLVMQSRDTCLTINETLIELSTSEEFVEFDKIAGPTAFNLKFFVPRLFHQWVFPTIANRIFFWVFLTLSVILTLCFISFSFIVNVFFFRDVYLNPTLGKWSTVILVYVGAVVLFGVLFLIRFSFPQPYRDQRVLL